MKRMRHLTDNETNPLTKGKRRVNPMSADGHKRDAFKEKKK